MLIFPQIVGTFGVALTPVVCAALAVVNAVGCLNICEASDRACTGAARCPGGAYEPRGWAHLRYFNGTYERLSQRVGVTGASLARLLLGGRYPDIVRAILGDRGGAWADGLLVTLLTSSSAMKIVLLGVNLEFLHPLGKVKYILAAGVVTTAVVCLSSISFFRRLSKVGVLTSAAYLVFISWCAIEAGKADTTTPAAEKSALLRTSLGALQAFRGSQLFLSQKKYL